MKDNIVRLVLIVVLLALYLAMNNGVSELLKKQEGMDITLQPDRSMMANLGRWMSHVNWMLLIQKRASMSGKPDPAVAQALHKRYDITTDQDPFLVMAYEHGGIELATIGQPELGLQLLDKGIGILGEDNWKLPSYAARIVSQYLKDEPGSNQRAKDYLEQAKKVAGHPFYIESALVRIQGREIKDDPVKMARLWKTVGVQGAREYPGLSTDAVGQDMQGIGDRYGKQVRDKVVSILRKVREKSAREQDPTQKAALKKQAAKIVGIIKSMMGAEHVCDYCFAEYQAGDSHCPNCGRGVEVYGVCVNPDCGKVLPPNAKFCPACGKKVQKKKAHEGNTRSRSKSGK